MSATPTAPGAATPAGFGGCARCAFAPAGSPRVCWTCAAPALRQPRDPALGLVIHRFDDIWAAALNGPVLAHALRRYKEGGHRGWARVFARLLVARLDALGERARRYDLIVASPTYVGVSGRGFGHTELVLDWVERQAAGVWRVAPGAVVRTRPAPRLKDCRGRAARLALARSQLRAAIAVAQPALVRGRSVLIFDDVLTTGVTCDEVARALLGAGALRAGVIVLARQPLRRDTAATPQP